jgi:uncharacterized protein (DUF2384 family)
LQSIRVQAIEVFGNKELADLWLSRATDAFGGKSPIDLCEMNKEDDVFQFLNRIKYGIYQ